MTSKIVLWTAFLGFLVDVQSVSEIAAPNYCKWPVFGIKGDVLIEQLCTPHGDCKNTEHGATCHCHHSHTGMFCQHENTTPSGRNTTMQPSTTETSGRNTTIQPSTTATSGRNTTIQPSTTATSGRNTTIQPSTTATSGRNATMQPSTTATSGRNATMQPSTTATSGRNTTTQASLETSTHGPKYINVSEKMSWVDAENYCVKQGGHLPCIYSKRQNEEILQYHLYERQWLGANATKNIPASGIHDFKWVDTGLLINSGYTNWRKAEPNNKQNGEFCLDSITEYEYLSDMEGVEKLKWNDESCLTLHPFVCVIQ